MLFHRCRALLADAGMAKAASEAQPHLSHYSTRVVRGSPGFMDPLVSNSLRHSELTDGYAFGITILVALTGRPAIGLLEECRHMLRHPERCGTHLPPTSRLHKC